MDNFQQTVDLRNRLNRQKKPAPKKTYAPIEKIYRDEAIDESVPEIQTISRPESSKWRDGPVKIIVFVLATIVVLATAYFLFFRQQGDVLGVKINPKSQNWYAVKLVDGTIYYGQVLDVKAEPVVLANVYYNYDQAKQAETAKDQAKTIEETGNIRLVKRGKETQGGDGSILAYHVNILVMEPLRSDSKILQAILEYEK